MTFLTGRKFERGLADLGQLRDLYGLAGYTLSGPISRNSACGINQGRMAAHQYRRSSTSAQTAHESIRVKSALARTRTKPLTIADEDQSATSERTTSQKLVGKRAKS